MLMKMRISIKLGLKINNIHVCALWVCINDKNDENAEKLQKNMRYKRKKCVMIL